VTKVRLTPSEPTRESAVFIIPMDEDSIRIISLESREPACMITVETPSSTETVVKRN